MDILNEIRSLIQARKEAEKRLRQMAMRADLRDFYFPRLEPLSSATKEIIQDGINQIRQIKGYRRYADYLQKMLNEGRIYGKTYYNISAPAGESDLWKGKIYLNNPQFNTNARTDAKSRMINGVNFMATLVHEATHMMEGDPWDLKGDKSPDENSAYAGEINFLINLKKQRPELKKAIDDRLEELKTQAGVNFISPLTMMQNGKNVHVRDYRRSNPPIHVHDYYRSFPHRRRILD